jgi:hypothetical protein
MSRNIGIEILLVVFVAVSLITWIVSTPVLLADDIEEEEMLRELTGEGKADGEGTVEVLGFTEKEVSFLGDKFFLIVIIIIAAAAGGLFLSFVIRSRT